MKQNPFSFYDFLGYIIPGASLLYLFYFGGLHYNWQAIIEIKSQLSTTNTSLGDLLNLFPLVIASYISGHALSLLSSFAIEKYSNLINGYPSQYLISDTGKGFFYKSQLKSFIGRSLLVLAIIPISALDILSRKWFRQNVKMDEKLLPSVFDTCKNLLNEKFDVDVASMDNSTGLDGDSFRLIYHYSYENSEQHAAKMQNYVALYGFTRNISIVSVIVFWQLIIMKFYFKENIGTLPILISIFSAFIFYKGFVKFYRRFTLEAMMAACAIKAKV